MAISAEQTLTKKNYSLLLFTIVYYTSKIGHYGIRFMMDNYSTMEKKLW